ncbi:MAG: hypothetical protein K8T89_26015 [Planctomycetes bacterium]|nr:hypothetical protein [Planctomycetota bacterium]
MKKWMLTLAVALSALGASNAFAEGIPAAHSKGPFSNHRAFPSSYNGQNLPVYQAAPWYLYWPYDAHFMSSAPMTGAFYAPPMMGSYPSQPYFPAQQQPNYGGPPMGGGFPMQGYAPQQALPNYGAPPVGGGTTVQSSYAAPQPSYGPPATSYVSPTPSNRGQIFRGTLFNSRSSGSTRIIP